jgi:hypothetical protein
MSADSAGNPGTGEPTPASREQDEVKAKFRDALDRKHRQQHAHGQGGDDGSKVHDTRGAATKRMFRRKSG